MQPSFPLQERLAALGLPISACYQCRKCSGGCPLTFAMDLYPDAVIRMALLGQEEQVLRSRTIWVCSSCETCTTRCPNGIDIAAVMDWLKEESVKRGFSTQARVTRFHQTFLDTIRLGGGRLQEPILLGLYMMRAGDTASKLKSGELLKELRLGLALAQRGRLKPRFPKRLNGFKEIKQILNKSK